LARAEAQGKRLGRPKIDGGSEQPIRSAPANGGKGILKIAGEHGVGSGTVQRYESSSSSRLADIKTTP
jgi:hypothetical protein